MVPKKSKMPIIASADETPPFLGRLVAAYRTPRAYLRGAVAGCGIGLAAGMDIGCDKLCVAQLTGRDGLVVLIDDVEHNSDGAGR